MANAAIVEKRINDHSKKITAVEEQQIEFSKILSGIDKKLSDEFFNKNEKVYEFLFEGNGVTSMKQWRAEIDKERATRSAIDNDIKQERRKWIFYMVTFALGALVNALFKFIK